MLQHNATLDPEQQGEGRPALEAVGLGNATPASPTPRPTSRWAASHKSRPCSAARGVR